MEYPEEFLEKFCKEIQNDEEIKNKESKKNFNKNHENLQKLEKIIQDSIYECLNIENYV